MEQVAEAGPQETGLRVLALTQLAEFLGRVADGENPGNLVGGFLLGRAVVSGTQVQHFDGLAVLPVETGACLLAQRTFLDQRGQPLGRLEVLVPGVVGQGVAHGLDDVRHGIQPHHVGGAVGSALGATDGRAGERVHHIEAQLEFGGVVHGRENGKHADAVADEVGRVARVHHALAQRGGQKGFQCLEHAGIGRLARHQFDQVHVAGRVEEVHSAEARAQLVRQGARHLVDGKAGCIAGNDCIFRKMRGNLPVEVELPVHAFGDGLDHKVAARQQIQVRVVVCRNQAAGQRLVTQRRGFQLAKVLYGLDCHRIAGTFLGRKVEQNGLDAGIGQVGGNLCPHDAGTQHGSLANG